MQDLREIHPILELKDISLDGLDPKELQELFDGLKNESDRNVVIIAVSLIEEILTTRLKKFAKYGTSKDHTEIFSDRGPFGNLYSKVEWLYVIGDIHLNFRNDIHKIRKLRNKAAHNWKHFKLDDYEDVVKSMTNHHWVDDIRSDVVTRDLIVSVKSSFTMLVSLIVLGLGIDNNCK